jgi:hypothetical protein
MKCKHLLFFRFCVLYASVVRNLNGIAIGNTSRLRRPPLLRGDYRRV